MRIRVSLRRLADDRGLSLVELIVATMLAFLILAAMLSVLDSGTRAERGTQARHSAILEAREAMTRISKDLRQALILRPSSTATCLNMRTLINGQEREVVYALNSGELRRAVSSTEQGCGGSGAPLARQVTSTDLFCYDYIPPDPDENTPGSCDVSALTPEPVVHITSVRVEIAVEPEVQSGGPITLAADVQLRNL